MIDRSYLLKYLQPKDRILLYYGKRGSDYSNYQYLKGQTQFQIVGIVTPDADQTIDPVIPMYYPYQLNAIPPACYDKIIISVRDQAKGAEMCQAIQEAGVDKKKIVAPYIYFGPASGISLEDFIGNPTRLQQEIERFINEKYGSCRYFAPVIEQLNAKKQECGAFLPQLKEIAQRLPALDSIVFLYVLSLAGIFDSELMKHLVRCSLQIDRTELRTFLHGLYFDQKQMCFLHEDYLFPEYYVWRRSLVKKLCEMYDLHIQTDTVKKCKDGKIHKILVVVCCLLNQQHSATRLPLQLCKTLVGLGYEVQVMPLDLKSNYSWEFPVFRPAYNFTSTCNGARDEEEYHKKVFPPEVTIEYTDIADPRKMMQDELDKIVTYSPDLIIDMSSDSSLISYIYSKYFTTLCLTQTGYQACTYFTYFAAREQAGFARENSIYHSVDESSAIEYPVCILPFEPKTVYKRQDFSLEDHDFVLVTVGNRLNVEMSSDFIDSICDRLLSKPNIKWLVVGNTNTYLSQTYTDYISSKKIIYISYEKDLPALYKICDLFVNPKRMGGGASITWAMHCGLPVATLSVPNDVMPVIGIENAMENYDQMMDYALHLRDEPEYWKQESEKFQSRELYFEANMPHMTQGVIHEIEKKEEAKVNWEE